MYSERRGHDGLENDIRIVQSFEQLGATYSCPWIRNDYGVSIAFHVMARYESRSDYWGRALLGYHPCEYSVTTPYDPDLVDFTKYTKSGDLPV
jgi:hypothetical protein